jgi:hypothetical protein
MIGTPIISGPNEVVGVVCQNSLAGLAEIVGVPDSSPEGAIRGMRCWINLAIRHFRLSLQMRGANRCSRRDIFAANHFAPLGRAGRFGCGDHFDLRGLTERAIES